VAKDQAGPGDERGGGARRANVVRRLRHVPFA
jgi:hypothetical protein